MTIHEYGDVSDNCANVGEEFNPYSGVMNQYDEVDPLSVIQDCTKEFADDPSSICYVRNPNALEDLDDINWLKQNLAGKNSLLGRSIVFSDNDTVRACCTITEVSAAFLYDG